jgi:probable F420-dependent oxidoreductase
MLRRVFPGGGVAPDGGWTRGAESAHGAAMSIRIGIGTALGAGALSPRDYWRWVDFCEDSGVDSIWHSDQLLGATPEPLTMLAALAGRTRRMKFGTNALVLPFREPLVVAKELATIDFLSGGRLFPVIGVGIANDPYWTATGANPAERGRRSDEAIALIRLLLEEDEARFDGTFFRYHGPGVQPRPPRAIPLWIGGQSKAAIQRTAAMGDGWLGSLVGPAQAGAARRGIEAALATTGRVIEPDHYGITLPMRIGDADDPAVAQARERLQTRLPPAAREAASAAFALGSTDAIIAILRDHVAAGMSKFVMLPLVSSAEELMEQTRLLVRHLVPAIELGAEAVGG